MGPCWRIVPKGCFWSQFLYSVDADSVNSSTVETGVDYKSKKRRRRERRKIVSIEKGKRLPTRWRCGTKLCTYLPVQHRGSVDASSSMLPMSWRWGTNVIPALLLFLLRISFSFFCRLDEDIFLATCNKLLLLNLYYANNFCFVYKKTIMYCYCYHECQQRQISRLGVVLVRFGWPHLLLHAHTSYLSPCSYLSTDYILIDSMHFFC